jgi:hypothetical protein
MSPESKEKLELSYHILMISVTLKDFSSISENMTSYILLNLKNEYSEEDRKDIHFNNKRHIHNSKLSENIFILCELTIKELIQEGVNVKSITKKDRLSALVLYVAKVLSDKIDSYPNIKIEKSFED